MGRPQLRQFGGCSRSAGARGWKDSNEGAGRDVRVASTRRLPAWAVEAGHDVTGVHLALSANPRASAPGARGCCSGRCTRCPAGRRRLGIPFYVVGSLGSLRCRCVWMTSLPSTRLGVLPILVCAATRRSSSLPCWTAALRLASTRSCTGHYARLVPTGERRAAAPGRRRRQGPVAARAPGVLEQAVINFAGHTFRSVLPARPTYAPKPEIAAWPSRRSHDSHDICFIANGDTAGFLDKQLGRRPGDIVDLTGARVGEHGGSHRFTVGQRRGLRLGTPADDHCIALR